MSIKNAKFGKNRFPKEYQKKVGKNARRLLHKNSIELVNVLKENKKLEDNIKIFEMGSGPARNLYYIWKENKTVELYANDLFKESSFENMSKEIKEKLVFFEGDSELIFNECKVKDLDLLIVSDHFMHLQYEKAENIIEKIISVWKPRSILLREVKKEYEVPSHPKLFHNYEKFKETYNLVFEKTSENSPHYFIWLLERK